MDDVQDDEQGQAIHVVLHNPSHRRCPNLARPAGEDAEPRRLDIDSIDKFCSVLLNKGDNSTKLHPDFRRNASPNLL